jgi:hypothetical protein
MNTRDLLAEATMARLAPASSPAGLSSVGTGSTKLRSNSYKTTKGEGISRKLKTESTIDKRYIKKSTRKSKTTHIRGGLSPQYSGTAWGTMVTPFRTFLRHSSTSSLVNSRVGTIRDVSAALEYSKLRCSLSFRG